MIHAGTMKCFIIVCFIKLFINKIENFQVLKKNPSPFLCLIYIGYSVFNGICNKFTYKYFVFWYLHFLKNTFLRKYLYMATLVHTMIMDMNQWVNLKLNFLWLSRGTRLVLCLWPLRGIILSSISVLSVKSTILF